MATGAVLRASARVYLLPVAGILAGAALAQVLAGLFLSAEAAGRAAGLGGIAGGIAAVLLARRLGAPQGTQGPLPTVTRVMAEAPSGDAQPGR